MATKLVTEPGIYGGVYRQAGAHYDDSQPEPAGNAAGDKALGQQGKSQGEGADDLDAKTKPELEALAAERGVDITKAKTKADVIETLRAPK